MGIHLKILIMWIIIVISVNMYLMYLGHEGFTIPQLIGQSVVFLIAYISIPYIIYWFTIKKLIDKMRKPKTNEIK